MNNYYLHRCLMTTNVQANCKSVKRTHKGLYNANEVARPSPHPWENKLKNIPGCNSKDATNVKSILQYKTATKRIPSVMSCPQINLPEIRQDPFCLLNFSDFPLWSCLASGFSFSLSLFFISSTLFRDFWMKFFLLFKKDSCKLPGAAANSSSITERKWEVWIFLTFSNERYHL